MSLLKLLKKFLFIQNFATSFVANIPPYLEFTLSKYSAIKKSMYITAHDKTNGSYIEFGVFTGSSFNFAMKVNKKLNKLLGTNECNFVGFDSFQGFGDVSKSDKHPRFNDEVFSVDEKKILKNIKKNSENQKYRIVKGFFDETLKKKPHDYEIEKARVVMIDCDLKDSALLALNFVKNTLQIGTIIIFDDFIFYKGDESKGEYAAFEEFKKENPNIKFRHAFDYGYGSKAFIVSKI
tara:strand:- start:13 stop:720 length:708 start_codon:yes stop_codon:yes gene_type:complete